MRGVLVCASVLCALIACSENAAAADDIVVYASDVSTINGNWARVTDATAAGGQKLSSSDNGWSVTNASLSNPADYFEVSVSAIGQVPYHVWVRMRAGGNSKWNDSIWLQFDDAVSASGAALYRISTSAGLLFNLETCSGCGTSEWGWVDGAYWLSQSAVVQFPSTGAHKIRVQTREDGVQIDQIVLSPARWFVGAPGQPSNDNTIVPKVQTPPSSSSSSSPFSGSAVSIPGTVQTENFDTGGEGVAYHDLTSGNTGGEYRSGGVDLQSASSGGYNVGWIDPGEWLQYSVNVTAAGTYVVSFRVASSGPGGTFHLESQGANISGALTIPDTGGWQSWQTVSRTLTLVAGQQTMRLVFDGVGGQGAVGNIDWVQFTRSTGTSQLSPYAGSPTAIPGTLQVEQFDNGGEGVSYHDETQGNLGSAFRSTDVDVEPSSTGGYNVGWTSSGEWLKYSVSVAATGSYAATFRVASPTGQGAFHLEANGADVTGTLTAPNTGGWQAWQTVSAVFSLQAGAQTLRLVIDGSGANFDSVQIATSTSTPPPTSGTTIVVQAGQNLQAAIDAANPGDTILLTPGAVYPDVVLPAKGGSDYITIRSSAPDSSLPAAGTRISPQDAALLPKIQGGAAGAPAMATALGAHHWRLQFLELVSTWPDGDILTLGDGSGAQHTLASVAHDLIVDRVYIHGVSGREQKRGIALNSASTTVINSYISNIREANTDTQAIAGWNGPGPFTIRNNYLEAAGENFLLGGADPSISNLVPSDVVFEGNTVTKQLAWRGQNYTVKNLIELKNARRVRIDGNIIEYNWESGQSGHAIVLTPRNQDGTAPWSTVQQIQITNNVIRHVSSVLNVLGTDNDAPSGNLQDVTFRNNIVLDLNKANWGGAAQLLLTNGGTNITVDHNTVFSDGTSIVYGDGRQVTGFVFTNNIIPDNAWAIMGSGASAGSGTLSTYFPGARFERNVLIGGQSSIYPAQNYFPQTISQVGFVDVSGNYRLSSGSPYRASATDGTAIGADINAINTAAGTSY